MYLDLPTEIEQLNNQKHAEQRMLDELMTKEFNHLEKTPKDVVIDINSGKPVQSPPTPPPLPDGSITKPFRPQRRTHFFNRRNAGLNNKLNSIRPSGPKTIKMFRSQKDHPMTFKINKISKPLSSIEEEPELRRPTLRPPTPIPFKFENSEKPFKFENSGQPFKFENSEKPFKFAETFAETNTDKQSNKNQVPKEKEEDQSNLVDQIFSEFEKGRLDLNVNDFIDKLQNSEVFSGLLKENNFTADKFINDIQETTSEMVDRLFNNIIKGDESVQKKTENEKTEKQTEKQTEKKTEKQTEKKTETEKKMNKEMNKDWVKFNQEIFDITKPHMPAPQAANLFSGYASFKPMETDNQSLLNNQDDQKIQKEVNRVKNRSLKLGCRLSKPETKQFKQMVDNFKDTNNQIITPMFMVEQLKKIKNRVLISPNQRFINLTNVCVNPILVTKIRNKYYERYPEKTLFSESISGSWTNNVNSFDSGRLLAILDEMINKYRCLSDDRKILDQTADIGEEIADTVKEYTEIKKKMAKLDDFNKKLDSVRQNLVELSQMSCDLDLFDGFESIDNQVLNDISRFQEGIQKNQVDKLVAKGEQIQAKFNYYQKMAHELINRVQIIAEMPTPDLGTYQLFPEHKNDLSKCFLDGHNFGIDTTSVYKPTNLQLRSDPPIKGEWEPCGHSYPFDLINKKNQ